MKPVPPVASIRRARVQDIPSIKVVLATTWRDTYSSLLNDAALERVANEWHTPQVLEAEIARPTTYSGVAACESGDVMAMVTANLRDDVLTITRLYVLPAAQRQGLGAALLGASIQAFPQAKVVRLEVEELNPKGRSFYRKHGFRELQSVVDDVAGVTLRSIAMERRL